MAHEILRDTRGGLSLASGRFEEVWFEPREVHAVLPGSNEEAKSIKGIAQAMGLEISSYIDWVRAERRLVWALGTLIKWGWVACDKRQKEEGHGFWYNAYWKTELANLNETVSICEAIVQNVHFIDFLPYTIIFDSEKVNS